jgi:hypothetical protein
MTAINGFLWNNNILLSFHNIPFRTTIFLFTLKLILHTKTPTTTLSFLFPPKTPAFIAIASSPIHLPTQNLTIILTSSLRNLSP